LDRILNINTQEKYKSGSKVNPVHHYSVHRDEHGKQNSRDSALFSPLAKLLSQINWHILSVEYPSEDAMDFNFLVDELEFKVSIDFTELYQNPFQEISIIYTKAINNAINKENVLLKVAKDDIVILTEPTPINITYLNVLFKRIDEYSSNSNFEITDKSLLNSFVMGIKTNINEELNYILKVLYTFISTRNKSRVKNNFNLKSEENNPIIMQKVAIIIAE
jgi:hypothetical protein